MQTKKLEDFFFTIKNYFFLIGMVEVDKTVLFLSYPLAPHEEVANAHRVMRLATKKLPHGSKIMTGLKFFTSYKIGTGITIL